MNPFSSIFAAAITLGLLSTSALASPRSSTNYNVATDITDAGGARATSASYTNDGSAGGVSGLSVVASPTETAKQGYIGQLYDIAGLTVNSAQPTVNEGATLQLGAWQLLDDASYLGVPLGSVAWSVASGPLTSINATGLATAGVVYQNTLATVQGAFGGFTGTLDLTVLDSIADNFGSYAGDGLDDAWQVQYFGQNNPNAGPTVDFDHTGQTNLFKFIAGLNPLDHSRFTITIAPVTGQPAQKNLIFTPVVAGRTYTVTSKPVLATGSFTPLTNPSAPSDNGPQRTITDLSASGPTKFYRVEITKP